MPVTLRFQSTGAVPGDGAPIVMRGPSLTIGRGQENDIVLPDPDKLISKNHCAIEDQGGGNVIVIDFSTNGTFLNYGKVPLGRVPTPLNDGDVLSMGPYEMVVGITTGRADPMRSLAAPVEDEQVSPGRAENAPDLMDLLDGTGSRKVDFLDDLLGAAEGPRGPSQVVREDPADELGGDPLLGDIDPVVGKAADPLDEFLGSGSQQYNSPSVSDAMSFGGRSKSVIPDDWDDDFLNPNKSRGADPFALHASIVPPLAPRPVPNLPPEAFDDILPGKPTVPPPPPPAEPAAAVRPDAASPFASAPPPPRPAPAQANAGDSPFAAPVPAARMSVVPPPPRSVAPSVVPPAHPAPPVQPAAPPPAPAPAAASAPAPAAPPRPAAPSGPPAQMDAARAFFRGAGQEDIIILDDQLVATMERLGDVMRTMVEGLRAVLMTRAEIKGEFRVERTQISAGGNNPLKFALSPEHAVEMMLRPRAKGYMDAAVAVREALDDIQAHEVAMVTGIEAAIRELLARMDPARIEEKAGGSGGFGGMLGNRKARAFEEFERLYADLKDKAENDFHDFFAKAFSRAYQEQLEKLKRERAQRT
jgi:type VI secretion system FHA domain protein